MRKLTFLCVLIFIFTLLTSETMYINLESGETVTFNTSDIEEITFGPDVSVEEMVEFISQIPIEFLKNYPNPFNPRTTISFAIAEPGKAKVEIFNIKGQKVKTLLNKHLKGGKHSVIWNGTDNSNKKVSSGVYFYQVSVNNEQKVKKMLMLK